MSSQNEPEKQQERMDINLNLNLGTWVAFGFLMFAMFVIAIIGGSIGVDYGKGGVNKQLYIMGIVTLVVTLVLSLPGFYHPLASMGILIGFGLGVATWVLTNKAKSQ